MPGPIALVGSGEYLPSMLDLERDLLEHAIGAGRPARYVQLATAAAPEGLAVREKWRRLGAEQAERLGVECVPVPVLDRETADDPAMAALIEDAGLIYLSGGNPAHLSDSLRGTRTWTAIKAAWRDGAALAGCSAGAMALTSWVPHLRPRRRSGPATGNADPMTAGGASDPGHVDGLGLLPALRVIPHFDRMGGWVPDLVTRYLVHAPDGVALLGIDEETALVGGPQEWTVRGRGQVWELGHGPRTGHLDGESLRTP